MRAIQMSLGIAELGARLYRPAKDDGCANPICRRHWQRREQAENMVNIVQTDGYGYFEPVLSEAYFAARAAVARLIVSGLAR